MNTVTRMKPLYYRSIWISDVHLGSKECKAEYLLDFLSSTRCDNLYLVGDIIDIWSYKRNRYWSQAHSNVINLLLEKARTGTRVVYVPGNHDEDFRKYCGSLFGNVELHRRFVHETADGRRFLMLHGDEFDHLIHCGRLLSLVGDVSYEFLIRLNRWVNIGRRLFGRPYWSLSSYIKTRVKKARQHIDNFEQAATEEARRLDMDGVICGHIHHADLSMNEGVLYCNDGDWVENCTAVVESHEGWLEILHWADQRKTMKVCGLNGEVEIPATAAA